MLWSVNTGGGYPYPNGTDIASYTSSADFKLLDTNGDGSITMADDPYAPYYPVRTLSPSLQQASEVVMETAGALCSTDSMNMTYMLYDHRI